MRMNLIQFSRSLQITVLLPGAMNAVFPLDSSPTRVQITPVYGLGSNHQSGLGHQNDSCRAFLKDWVSIQIDCCVDCCTEEAGPPQLDSQLND